MISKEKASGQIRGESSVEAASSEGESASGEALPEGWAEAALGEVVEIWDNLREPVNAKERATRQGPYPYYGANGQAGTIDDYRFDGDYALIAEDGGNFDEPEKGVAYRVTGKFWVNNHAHVLKGSSEMTSTFLVHLMNSMDWMPFVSGTTRLKLNQGKLKSAPLKVPPLAEQSRIVSAIESLQERSSRARDLLSEVGPLIGQLRQSLLRAAFSGRLTAAWREQNPDVEPASELLTRIRTERRQRWEAEQLAKYEAKGKKPPKNWQDKYKEPEPVDESELPKLPEGWYWTNMDTISHRVSVGHVGPTSKFYCDADEGIPFLRSQNVRPRRLSKEGLNYIVPEFHNKLQKSQLQKGDILVVRVGANRGDTCRVPAGYDELNCANIVFARPCGQMSEFIELFCQSDLGQSLLLGMSRGGAQGVINTTSIAELPIPICAHEEQAEIIRRVDQALETVSEVESGLASMESSLTQLDQSILSKAFRGELVSQDPSDEPASQLLARIREKRQATSNKRR
ncbi:restriction endonuclease subunit S [Roseiconus lacunae]|uniref:restriction endonuclease subunit S n=1 Tax=Roseiconus lacunae TaxID=2605694 RepID=UPI001E367C2E|nr:restriction endonuclease subunit S [Roseiconus lacunae]MCD0458591.1 restriction endonuclease subunit S [Roseiconus lacunae]